MDNTTTDRISNGRGDIAAILTVWHSIPHAILFTLYRLDLGLGMDFSLRVDRCLNAFWLVAEDWCSNPEDCSSDQLVKGQLTFRCAAVAIVWLINTLTAGGTYCLLESFWSLVPGPIRWIHLISSDSTTIVREYLVSLASFSSCWCFKSNWDRIRLVNCLLVVRSPAFDLFCFNDPRPNMGLMSMLRGFTISCLG